MSSPPSSAKMSNSSASTASMASMSSSTPADSAGRAAPPGAPTSRQRFKRGERRHADPGREHLPSTSAGTALLVDSAGRESSSVVTGAGSSTMRCPATLLFLNQTDNLVRDRQDWPIDDIPPRRRPPTHLTRRKPPEHRSHRLQRNVGNVGFVGNVEYLGRVERRPERLPRSRTSAIGAGACSISASPRGTSPSGSRDPAANWCSRRRMSSAARAEQLGHRPPRPSTRAFERISACSSERASWDSAAKTDGSGASANE